MGGAIALGEVARRASSSLGQFVIVLPVGAGWARRAGIVLIVLNMFCSAVVGQQSPQPADQTEPAKPDQPKTGEKKAAEQGGPSIVGQAANAAMKPVELFNLLQRKSIVFPDIAASTGALSPGQKFELFVDNSVSVHTVVWATLGSLVGQADDAPTGYGVGGTGYAKRLGSSLARESSGQFFGTFIVASALREDPRFFPEYNPTFKQSMKYSLRRLFVTRNDRGEDVANMPGLLGPLLGEGLANAYWPERNRTVGDTFMRYGLDLASRAAGNMFREYWPVVSTKMRRVPPQPAAPR